MYNPHQVTREFEKSLCQYTGAPFAVAVNSCTVALFLACAWNKKTHPIPKDRDAHNWIEIPNKTYVSVPMVIKHAGFNVLFRDELWSGDYQLIPYAIFDSARRFTGGMFQTLLSYEDFILGYPEKDAAIFSCVSFHSSKILGDSQGGAILHNDPEADVWFRKARFDGRTEGVPPKHDHIDMLGWHCSLSPDVATRLLWKMQSIPEHNEDLPNDEYSDLSLMEIFR